MPMSLELLAPAGTVPAFEAALAEGADAVYLGAPAFNARALARDFSFAEIAAMIETAHGQGRRVHLAMNSLVKEDELVQAVETLARIARLQADALIVQDLGLIRLARRFFPELPLHASTLMAAHNSIGVEYLAGLGCSRVVLARELDLEEIGRIGSLARAAGVELELFVHGAMCFSYSGLCRFSSLHGGKSSLRGQCVQPCRRRYQWLSSGKNAGGAQDGGYFFSMNDLSGLGELDALAKAGIASLKIEGRLKSVAYVRNAVRAYRLALDARQEQDYGRRTDMLKEAQACLDAAMGRRRSRGFFPQGAAQEADLISPEQSGNTGALAAVLQEMKLVRRQGKVAAVQITAQLRTALRAGDRLRLHEERSDSRCSFTLRQFRVAGKSCREAGAGEVVEIRLSDPKLFALRPPFAGKIYRVDVSGRKEQISSGLARLIAQEEGLRAQATAPVRRVVQEIARETGMLPSLGGQTEQQFFAPRQGKGKRTGWPRETRAEWWLKASSLEALRLRLPFPLSRLLLDLNAETLALAQNGQIRRFLRSAKLIWALPAVMLEERLDWYRHAITRLQELSFSSFQLAHPGQIGLFSGADDGRPGSLVELFGDFSFNLLNHSAINALAEQGYSGLQFSLETDRPTLMNTLTALASHKAGKTDTGRPVARACALGLLAYGRPALFTSRLQAPHFKGRHTLKSPHGERYFLKQQQDSVCVYPHQPFSLLAHARDLSALGLDYLVVDISRANPKREAALIAALWSGKVETPHFSGNYSGVLA